MAGADPSNPSDPSSSSSSPSPSAPRIIRTRRNRDRDRNLASPGPALAGASSELDAIPELAGAASPISHQPDDIRAPAWYTAREGDGDGDGDGEPAPAKNLAQRGLEGLSAFSTLVYPDKYLGYLSTSALMVNRVVGSGIFDLAPILLDLVGSKGAALCSWLLGCLVTLAGMIVYIEYGIRFPLTGGELYYIDFLNIKPMLLVTYMYAIMFTILSGSQGNALSFGAAVQIAASPGAPVVNGGLQKLLAIALVGLVCLAQAYSRGFNVLLSNAVALYKILLLVFISVTGLVVIGGTQSHAAREAYSTPYGKENFNNAFEGTSTSAYNWGVALLLTQRAFFGYENTNLIMEEIRQPVGDEFRVFRRSAKVTIILLASLYILVNVAFFAACSSTELHGTSDVTALFLQKVFGPSHRARRASGILRAISSGGNVVAFTYSIVRVKQEIARMGILPFPEFWAKSTRGGAPGPALLLHFFFTSLFVICTPLGNANGYLVISTLFTWTRTWVGVILGIGLLLAWKLDTFRHGDDPWSPKSIPQFGSKVAMCVVMALAALYTAANAFIFGLCWYSPSVNTALNTKSRVLPSYAGPAVGVVVSVLGVFFWTFDRHVLPAFGYRVEVEAERKEGTIVHMKFKRYISGPSMKIYSKLYQAVEAVKALYEKENSADPANEPLTRSYLTSTQARRWGN